MDDRCCTAARSPAHANDFQQVVCFNSTWSIPTRYQELTPSWSSTQALVCLAVDQGSGQRVLVERLPCAFHSVQAARATYKRVRLLTRVDHENLISLVDCFSPSLGQESFSELYFASESYEHACDLGTVIRSQSLSDGHVCVLTYQILRALKYLHSAGIVHGDLKPADLLVNEDCQLVLTNLGVEAYDRGNELNSSSSSLEDSTASLLSLLDSGNVRFGQAADVWSVGCIMAEMITSRALFPGRDHVDQLKRIQQTLGSAKEGDEATIARNSKSDVDGSLGSPRWETRALAEIFAGANAQAVNLLEQLLALDREKRITVEEALRHPYFEQYHDPDDEPTASELLDDSASVSNESDCVEFWRQKTRQVVLEWRKEKQECEEHRQSLKVTMTI